MAVGALNQNLWRTPMKKNSASAQPKENSNA